MGDDTFRIIHTSDWHLGQHFMGKSRQYEHKQFLAWLIKSAVKQKAQAIVVSGDIFDTGSPPSYARELYNRFIVDLHSTGIQLIILGGNHDSTATLGESKALLACLNTHVIPGALANMNDQVIELTDASGQPQAIVCAIPFLRPRDILQSAAGQDGAQKQQNLQQAISHHYHEIYNIATKKQASIFKALSMRVPIIATGHLTTVGAKSSTSVRDIYIGSLEAFPSSSFPPADYIALGHIHRSQVVGGEEHIRYCGSPIALSFDELNKEKSVLFVTFKKECFVSAEPIFVPRFQPMHKIKGDLNEINNEIKALARHYEHNQPAWLDIEVCVDDFLTDLQWRIQDLVDGLPLEVLKITRQKKLQSKSTQSLVNESLHELSPNDVFERRLSLEVWEGDDRKEKKNRLLVAFNRVLHELDEPDKL